MGRWERWEQSGGRGLWQWAAAETLLLGRGGEESPEEELLRTWGRSGAMDPKRHRQVGLRLWS